MRLRPATIFTSVLAVMAMASGSAPALSASPESNEKQLSASAQGKETLWVIPHTHWEGAVFKTREEYLEMALNHITKVLHLMKTHPEYRFALDQAAYFKPFLERYPEEEATFRKFVAEGRLQLVGGTVIMPDVNMPSGETFVRQILYGKGYCRDKLGVEVTSGWTLDSFGHHAQMPQILKLGGFNSYWFFRGVSSREVPSEFLWQGIDGTQIPAFWLPYGYGIFYESPTNITEFDRFARGRFGALTPFTRGSDRVALAGADVSDVETHLPGMIERFNQQPNAPFQIRFGVPKEFEAVVAKRSDQPVVTGELNPIFQGIYSSRIDLKQWTRKIERQLTQAEKWGVLARWLGAQVNAQDSLRAWEPALFNQTHDLASGVMVDKVYNDTVRQFEVSKHLGTELAESWWEYVAAKIDSQGEGIPIAVFNPLGWPRTDAVEVKVGVSEPGQFDLTLVDPGGQAVPVQIVEAERYDDGGIKEATIVFVARDVPAMGYSVYRVIPTQPRQPAASDIPRDRLWGTSTTAQEDQGTIENEFYRATFHLWTGEMTSLVDKATGWEVLSGSGNVVAKEQDGGDFWELYGSLNGGRNIAMKKKVGLPPADRSKFSSEWVGGSGSTDAGPVFAEYQVSHPFGKGNFATRVRVYNGIRRVDFQTKIFNNDEFVRYRVLFPSSIKNGKRMDEIPFGAIERPMAEEFPAQYWMHYGDDSRGVALLNRAMPGNNVADGTLMLSLMRSTRITAYAFYGGYEPGVSSDTGLELGKELTFDYALAPHSGDWRTARVYQAGWEFNHPLVARKLTTHAGGLPNRWGLLEFSHPNVLVSAMKPGRDGSAILRVYEASGQATSGVKLKVTAGIASAHEANLMEDADRELKSDGSTVQFDLHPYEIKTLKLQFRPFQARK